MAGVGDPHFDDSTETQLRPPDEATLTSGPKGASPAEPATLVHEGSSGALPDLGLTTIPREHYLVEGEIARGGMGRVIAARDRRLGRPVALKELLSSSPDLARRFEREALMTARLQHPSIVNVHEAGRWPSGEPFFAMKRVVGRPLDRVVLEAGSLDGRLALLPKVLAVAEALAYAHEQGVIHRDLKPANVLVGSFGETVVVDWGLAKDLLREGAFDESEEKAAQELGPDGLTVVGTVMGTPAYMAPEQARGERVDERADVYALGAILYTVLAGAPPYMGPSSTAVLEEVLKGPPPALEERQPGLPEDLLALVRKAMAAGKEDRYRTAREFAEDLRRYQTGQLVGAHRYSPGQIVRRWVRRHRAVLGVASAAAFTLVVSGGIAVRRIQIERDAAQARNDELILAQARSHLETDPTTAVAWLKHYSLDAPKWGAVRMIAADARSRGIARRALPGHDADVMDLAFSPDGMLLASVGVDYVLRLWDARTGAGRLLFRSNWHARSVEFSPDGQRIAFGHGMGKVGLWDIHSGKLDGSADGASGVERVWFTGDGRDLLFLGRGVGRWDLVKQAYRFRNSPVGDWIPEMALSADRQRAVTRNERGEVLGWDLETGKRQLVLPGIEGKDTRYGGVAYWGDVVASGRGADIWVVRPDGTRLAVLRGHGGRVRALAASRDGKWLASGGEDWTVRIWARDGSQAHLLRGHTDQVEALVFSPDGKTLASLTRGADNRLLLWDTDTGRTRVLSGETRRLVAFSPDGATIATADRGIRLWSAASDATFVIPGGANPSDFLTAVSPDSRFVATGGEAPGVRYWDIGARTAHTLPGPTLPPKPSHAGVPWDSARQPVRALRFSADGRVLAAGGDDERTYVWNLATGAQRQLAHDAGRVFSIAFSPNGRLLAVGAERGISLWDLAAGTSRQLKGHAQPVGQLNVSPDGDWLASAPMSWIDNDRAKKIDTLVTLWNTTTGEKRTLAGHEDTVFDAAFSPDGRSLASGSLDHTVRVWDLKTGTSRVLRGHGDLVFTVTFSPDGRQLVSTSNDGTTRIWDLESGQPKTIRFGGGQRPAFSPDGLRLCRVGGLWDLQTLEHRQLLPAIGWGAADSLDCSTFTGNTERGELRVWTDDLPLDRDALRAWLDTATDLRVEVAGPARDR